LALFAPAHATLATCVLRVAAEGTVPDGRESGGDRRLDLPRHLVVREVVGREPIVVVVILALTPDLSRCVGALLDERQATSIRDLALLVARQRMGVAQGDGATWMC